MSFVAGFRYFVEEELEHISCFHLDSFWWNDDLVF